MQGSKLLKITGIIMTIFGAIALLANLFSLIVALDIESSGLYGIGISPTYYWTSLLLSLISSILYLLLGIFGIKNWQNPEKSNICIIVDIIFILTILLGNIFSIVINSLSPFFYFSIITSLILPVLYLVAAFQLKKMGKQ